MTPAHLLHPQVQASLARLARTSDRAAPTVFAGRDDEFTLLNNAVQGVRDGENGHTVVIQGVPGAGKTALMDEFAARSFAHDAADEGAVIPVLLDPGSLGATPSAIIESIDASFRDISASSKWDRLMTRVADGATHLGNAMFAAATKQKAGAFMPSAKAPNSLPIALAEYVGFRFGRKGNTVVLLVDESQNLEDTPAVRRHLNVLHQGITGKSPVLLACFGLPNTVSKLAELGLSRLASDHVQTIGMLSSDDAHRVVAGTLNDAFSNHAFDDGSSNDVVRNKWIGKAASVILNEGGGFPHHLTNGCRALAKIVLDEGVADSPPVGRLREECLRYRREYYDARLRPWSRYRTALAHAFAECGDGRPPTKVVVAALTTVERRGEPIAEETAWDVVEGLCDAGFVAEDGDALKPLLPSLASHFQDVRRITTPNDKLIHAVRSAPVTPSRPAAAEAAMNPERAGAGQPQSP